MRKRSERTLKELYDRTERILNAEGPVDDPDLEFERTNSGLFSTIEKFTLAKDCFGMKLSSGTCNICSAPCSSCMHDFNSSSAIGSTSDSGCSGNICYGGKADICYSVGVNGTTLDKRKTFDDSQNVSSETSNMLGMCSSHNSHSENAKSKSALKASAAHDLEDLDKPQIGFPSEIIKKEQHLGEKAFQGHFSADSHISIHLGCRDLSCQGEDQAGLECHGDNISCITGGTDAIISDDGDNLYLNKKNRTCVVLTNSLILDWNETSVLAEAGDGLQVHETVEGDFRLRRANATADASILNDISNYAFVSMTTDNYGFPSRKVDGSPISISPISHSKNTCSSFDKADCSDTEGNLNVKLQTGCMKFEKMDNVESLLGTFSAVRSAWGKHVELQNGEVSRTNEARIFLNSKKLKVDDLSQELRTETNIQISCGNVSRSDLSEPLEKDNALLDLETVNRKRDNFPPLLNTEIEISEFESALYDVKVCDICGDVGRETQLAICSCCSDGAEHTYCMREKLDKLPGADWQCEECKIKKMGKHNVNKSGTICRESKPIFLSKNSQNSISTLIPKKLPKLNAGLIDLNDEVLAKRLESPKISSRKQADHAEEMKVSEASNAPIKTESLRKTPVVSQAISFKNQKRKLKKANMESSEGQSVNALQAFHYSQNSLSPGSFKGKPQAHSRCNDNKKRILHSVRSMEFSYEKFGSESGKQCEEVISSGFNAVNGLCDKTNTASQHGVLQPSDSDPKDNRIRTGHATQQYATDKLEGSSHWPSDELNLREMMKKGKGREDVVDATVPNTKMLNKSKNLYKYDKLPETSGGVICQVGSINTSTSFNQRNIALVGDKSNDNDGLKLIVEIGKAVAATDSENLPVILTESLVVPKENRSSHIPTFNELNVKSLSETSPGETSLANQLRASAIPKREFIWQGSFSVLGSNSFSLLFDGIQAHLSTFASERVFEVASVVPRKLHLVEVSQTSLWPLPCQGICPTEENIALFFFAKDNESYEKSYGILLNKMLKNDLALRGKVDEAELLIFTSKMLPAYSNRWNMLYYLWGMFIGKRKNCLPAQKNCESNSGIEFLGEGISERPLRNGPNAQNLDTTVTSMIFSEYDASPKINQGESIIFMDSYGMSSEVEPKSCRKKTTSHSVNSSSRVATDAKIIQEIPLSLIDNSSSTTAKPLDVIDNADLQLQSSRLSYKVNIGIVCQDKFLNNGTNGKFDMSPPLAFDTNIEVCLGRASPSVSPICSNSVEECSKNECKKKKRRCSPTDLAILGYNPRENTSEIDWGDKNHELSCSAQPVSQSSGERATWMQADDERGQKKTYYNVGEENFSSSIFCPQQHTQNICSEPVMPEISSFVEISFFPVVLCPSSNNKFGKLSHIASSNVDDNPESYTPDLELTLGNKSKETKPAPLLTLLFPSVDRGSQHRRSDSPGNDGDELSAWLSL